MSNTRFQRRIAGVRRLPGTAAFLPELRETIERDAKRFKVSKSLLIAVAVADAMGIDIGEDPISAPKRKGKR